MGTMEVIVMDFHRLSVRNIRPIVIGAMLFLGTPYMHAGFFSSMYDVAAHAVGNAYDTAIDTVSGHVTGLRWSKGFGDAIDNTLTLGIATQLRRDTSATAAFATHLLIATAAFGLDEGVHAAWHWLRGHRQNPAQESIIKRTLKRAAAQTARAMACYAVIRAINRYVPQFPVVDSMDNAYRGLFSCIRRTPQPRRIA